MGGQNLSDRMRTAAERIDEHYDRLLYDGMSMEQARLVESQRQAAHDDLTRQVMQSALTNWRLGKR